MSAPTSGGGALSPQAAAALQEGIRLVFGRWTALQIAVEHQQAGRDSRAKADQLAESILSWFCNSKGPYYYDDLDNMIYGAISGTFNSDFVDGSIEEVAEQILIMHEGCLQGNYSSIEKLRNTHVQGNAVSLSRQMVTDDDDDSSDDDGEPSMAGNEAVRPDEMVVDEPKPSKPVPDADGFTPVAPRRRRGKN
ncbi:pre-rRNA-processing protein TSR2 [Brachypodium distachyon]|uniref:Pre-rRNA-processing protein TSR2 homolog n=1 Tax=Brachypodium distachyon TaxID=15368 RepID=I1IHZ1_BRADI|nr:pre-rRNA-processing protein TSR2 [Brachypodium distachyon]KQJ86519.1 hypothetical protein BRADI_4g06060v3 [Brachypodium distachyon]|eukprot:XP_003575879.1 pre-rRNA-processing protein TSR2 [Brachypodium distachyon]